MGFAKKAVDALHPHTLILGRKKSAQFNLAGQLAGTYDDLYKPAKVEPIPSPSSPAAANDAYTARDFSRRLARRAQGRDSTVRTGPGGAPYDAAPKRLLGS